MTASIPYRLAVALQDETVEATSAFLDMTIEHDTPLLPGVDDAADAEKYLLK